MQINMSVALPERSRPPHKVLLVMPDLQIFIISPPDNLIMHRSRIHFAPLRKPARDALFPDYFPALPAALYKPTRTPSIMLFSSLASSAPSSAGSKAALFLLSGAGMWIQRSPKGGWGWWKRAPLAHNRPLLPSLRIWVRTW